MSIPLNQRDPIKVYRCKFCHVRVISKDDTRAILGQSHGKNCRRRFKG